ncbi:hypothetical protein [Chryseobacterium sp. SL1]|uniref:hypothetical protein n=1 Tax=Chryseobacterium sp. SL1 TaxID=2995159 RepID=UPI0022734368|nr:hypothetical protein [Chryseobacterium sp. SL1]MCY1662602.1 hypothetical protein [Chryseobacterium sp. SL1]
MNEETTNKQVVPGQVLDILLIMDKNDKKVYGMQGVGEYDEFETATVKRENLELFKRFDKNGNLLRDFLVEFFSGVDNPSRYKFFLVPESAAVELAGRIQISVNDPSKEGELILNKYSYQTNHIQERIKSLEENIASQSQQQEKRETPAKSRGRKM